MLKINEWNEVVWWDPSSEGEELQQAVRRQGPS